MCIRDRLEQVGPPVNGQYKPVFEGLMTQRRTEKILLTALTLLYYISSALVLFFISSYVKEYLKLTKRQSKYFILTVAVLCIVQVILALLSPLTGSIFYINENGYQRGNLFLLSQVIPVLNMILCIICIFVNRKKLSGREMVFFHLYLLLPPVSMLIQTMFRGLGIVSPIITLNILCLLYTSRCV